MELFRPCLEVRGKPSPERRAFGWEVNLTPLAHACDSLTLWCCQEAFRGMEMSRFERCAAALLITLALAICPTAWASPPPVPNRPAIRAIEIGSQGEVFALVLHHGVFRRVGAGRWARVLGDGLAALGDIYERDDGALMLTSFVSGSVYRSLDRGVSWQVSGTVQPLAELVANREYGNTHAITATGDAFALSGAALHMSVDGGQVWQRLALPGNAPMSTLYRQAVCADDTRLYFVDDTMLWRSDDRGRHWHEVVQQAPLSSPIVQRDGDAPLVLRIDADGVLFALGSPAADQPIHVSRDGGATWQRERFGIAPDTPIVWRLFSGDWSRASDGERAFYVLERGAIPGVDVIFRRVHRLADGMISEIHYPGSQIGGLVADTRGVLYLTTNTALDAYESSDGGRTWTLVPRDGID